MPFGPNPGIKKDRTLAGNGLCGLKGVVVIPVRPSDWMKGHG